MIASKQRHADDTARIMIVTEDLNDTGSLKSALQSKLKNLEFIVSPFEMANLDLNKDLDLILVDMGETIKDVTELISRIRQSNKFKATSIVALTAQETNELLGADMTIQIDEFESRVSEVTQLIVDSWLGVEPNALKDPEQRLADV